MADRAVPGWVHFFAGATGGSVGILITCPLEVVKTRMQSSISAQFLTSVALPKDVYFNTIVPTWRSSYLYTQSKTLQCLDATFRTEGIRGLWRGLGPNLIGVIPSRSIYFTTYSYSKRYLQTYFQTNDNTLVHLGSAIIAGFTTTTTTNPIWLIKTRLQLKQYITGGKSQSTMDCIKEVWRHEGLRGFYRGLAASYLGIAETSLQFVLYEYLKKQQDYKPAAENITASHFFLAAGCSKFLACLIFYPHEVLRTRMREIGPVQGLWGACQVW